MLTFMIMVIDWWWWWWWWWVVKSTECTSAPREGCWTSGNHHHVVLVLILIEGGDDDHGCSRAVDQWMSFYWAAEKPYLGRSRKKAVCMYICVCIYIYTCIYICVVCMRRQRRSKRTHHTQTNTAHIQNYAYVGGRSLSLRVGELGQLFWVVSL